MHEAGGWLRGLGAGRPSTHKLPLRASRGVIPVRLSLALGSNPFPTQLQCSSAHGAKLGLGIWVHQQPGSGVLPAAGALSLQLSGVEQSRAAAWRHPHLSPAGAFPDVAGYVDGVYPHLGAD